MAPGEPGIRKLVDGVSKIVPATEDKAEAKKPQVVLH